MTNAQAYAFVESIRERFGDNKHALRNLSSAQFKKLREIAQRYNQPHTARRQMRRAGFIFSSYD